MSFLCPCSKVRDVPCGLFPWREVDRNPRIKETLLFEQLYSREIE